MMDAADDELPLTIELRPIDAASNRDDCASDNADDFEPAAGSDD